MVDGWVFDIKRFAIHDGPGIRTTVFLQGCPLRCAWCHNPEGMERPGPVIMFTPDRCIACELCVPVCAPGAIDIRRGIPVDRASCTACGACVDACPTGARKMAGRKVSAHEVIAEVERDTPFYDQSGGGVTFSGGEPLVQVDFLRALLASCRERHIHTVVDTSGFAPLEDMMSISSYTDLFLYDLKAVDPGDHVECTGVDNAQILTNLEALIASRGNVIIRIPLIPGVNTGPRQISQMVEYLASLPTGGVMRVDVLPYHRAGVAKYGRLGRAYTFDGTEPPGEAIVNGVITDLGRLGYTVKVGG